MFRLRSIPGCFAIFASLCMHGRAGDLLQQAPAGTPVADIYIARTAEQLTSPNVVTYRFVEYAQARGRWIFPDVAYYDTGYGQDQLWLAAVGAKVIGKPRFAWTQQLYFAQEAGPDATNKRSVRIWAVLDARYPHRFTSQVVPYPTIPLDRAQRAGFNFDRARMQWSATTHWRTGIGYSGGIAKDRSWQSMPFVSVTRTTRAGEFDLWVQQNASGAQVQIRYLLVHSRE